MKVEITRGKIKTLSNSLHAKGIQYATEAAAKQGNRIEVGRLSTPNASLGVRKEALITFLHNIMGTLPSETRTKEPLVVSS